MTLQRRRAAEIAAGDQESFFLDTLAEYPWARDTAGLAASTLDKLVKPVVEICRHYGVVPWHAKYPAGCTTPPSQRAMKEFLARWRDLLEHARKPAVACRSSRPRE